MREHYENQHQVDKNNFFYKALFAEKKRNFTFRKCFRCESFLVNEKQERKHNSLRHLQQGGAIPIENLPLLRESSGTIIRFSINYERHKDYYNFEKPSELIENFFFVIDLRFDTDDMQEYIIKCSFCIRNYQPPPEDVNNAVGLYDKRFWSTETYNGRFFNEYIKTPLMYDIKK